MVCVFFFFQIAVSQAYNHCLINLITGAECIGDLARPLGMENRFIRDEQISASSQYSQDPPWDGRLNNDGYWSTAAKNPSDQQWIQIDFLDSTTTGNNVIITGIQTQGSGDNYDCWVERLHIQTSNTTNLFDFIYEEGTTTPKVRPFT